MTTTTETSTTGGAQASAPSPSSSAGMGAWSRWTPVAGGLIGGIVAAGAAGTSTETIYLGAVWAGTAAGVLIVALAAYLAVREVRARMPSAVFRRQLKMSARRTVSWALAAYVFWFLIIEPELSHAGIFVPMLR